MGAYYEATLVDDENVGVKFSTHDYDNGLKLMEHSYLGNNYCKHIMSLIHDNPMGIVWLCDYHEPDSISRLTWDTTDEAPKQTERNDFPDDIYYIVNESDKLFIDIKKLEELYEMDERADNWHIHPIPILCNSDRHSLGGGDFHQEDSRRATWCEDKLFTTKEKPDTDAYEDVTADVLFFEEGR